MTKLEKQLNIEATLESLDTVIDELALILEESGAGMKIVNACQLSVEEIFVNIVNYAYAEDEPEKTCLIRYCTEYDEEKGVIRIELIDQGKQFDPFAKEDPDITLGIDERPIGGLGIFMAKKLMDKAEYKFFENENTVMLEKSWKV